MDAFAPLDETILSRLFSCMLQRDALILAGLSSEWPHLVGYHLRRLVVSPTIPLAAVIAASGSFRRLREVVVDGRLEAAAQEIGVSKPEI